jgi:hypothetical protein
VKSPDRNPRLRLPWLSLALLLVAYATFSWFLTHAFAHTLTFSTAAYLAWGLVLAFTLLQALLLTTLFDELRRLIARWLRSDAGYFVLILVFSLSLICAFVWNGVAIYLFVLATAELLARLDLERARVSRLQALLILTLISMTGLAIGLLASLKLATTGEVG